MTNKEKQPIPQNPFLSTTERMRNTLKVHTSEYYIQVEVHNVL